MNKKRITVVSFMDNVLRELGCSDWVHREDSHVSGDPKEKESIIRSDRAFQLCFHTEKVNLLVWFLLLK